MLWSTLYETRGIFIIYAVFLLIGAALQKCILIEHAEQPAIHDERESIVITGGDD